MTIAFDCAPAISCHHTLRFNHGVNRTILAVPRGDDVYIPSGSQAKDVGGRMTTGGGHVFFS